MLIKPHIPVEQGRRSVDSLFRGLVFYGNDIPVAIGLYARIRQAPFQNGVVVVYDFMRRRSAPSICMGRESVFAPCMQ